jgi:hypothetical protein
MFKGLSKAQSYTLGFFGLLVATVGLGWLGKSMIDNEPLGAIDFWHEGYYRDDNMTRLFTIGYRTGVSETDKREFARQLTHTPGHRTKVFFYPEGSRIPGRAITGAASLVDAREALRNLAGASRWRYAALHDENGDVHLVDCEAQPNDRLCAF